MDKEIPQEMSSEKVNPRIWNSLDPKTFLKDDRSNIGRNMAAGKVSEFLKKIKTETKQRHVTMLEIGCCNGIDYRDYFRQMENDGLIYHGLDISKKMIESIQKDFPDLNVRVGGFTDLRQSQKYDITYVKAVFEHQPDFAPPLKQLLSVTQYICIINWYLPPGRKDEAKIQFSEGEQVYYNRYEKALVEKVIKEAGFQIKIEEVPNGNTLYYITKAEGKTIRRVR